MVNFVTKLQDLEDKIVEEFDTLKSYQRDSYRIDSKNHLDILLFKIKYQINQIRENEDLNNDTLAKSQMLTILKDLKEKIVTEFLTFKYYNNDQNDPLDTMLFKIKYLIGKIENDVLLGTNDDDSNGLRNIETKKANALIRMQTLANLITCRIINLNNL